MALSGTINGSCSGTSGDKYDFWLDWTVNSQNTENNTSNITTTTKLQRNDGFNDSAYNLTGSASGTIVADGSTKASGSLNFDTRNDAIATIKTVTFTQSHEEDGTLSLPLIGTLISDLSTVGNGSISGSASVTSIPRGIIRFNDSGVWRQGLTYINVSGTWKQATGVYVKVGSMWEQSI